MLSCSDSFEAPWTAAHQASLSMEFSRQECWSGLPFPTPGDSPNPGIRPKALGSPALADRFFTTVLPGKPIFPLLYGHQSYWISTTLLQCNLTLTNYICKDPTSKSGPILRCWGLGCQPMNLGRGTQLTHHNSSLLQNDIVPTSTSFSNLFLFLFVLAAPNGLWGLGSPTKNGTQVLGRESTEL